MKKQMKRLAGVGLAGVLALGISMTSFAQSDGVINYNGTFEEGQQVGAYVEEEYSVGTVKVFNNKNFTFSIDVENLLQKMDINAADYDIHHYVWLGFINENEIVEPITANPYYDIDIKVKEVGDGVYSLEGLDIKDNVVYAIMADMTGSRKPGGYYGGGNAGGGGFSGVTPSFFTITSSGTEMTSSSAADNTETSNISSSNEDSDRNQDGGDSLYYYWMHNEIGWWVQCSNGTYLTSQWYKSPASGLYYYMGADGYMLTDTVTPDGYYVNADGVWIP